MSSITIQGVYYVDTPSKVGHVAIRPTFQEKIARWEDTSGNRTVRLSQPMKELPALPSRIELVFEKQITTLEYLTLELYNEKLKSKVVGSPTFSSTEEVQRYYLETNFIRYE